MISWDYGFRDYCIGNGDFHMLLVYPLTLLKKSSIHDCFVNVAAITIVTSNIIRSFQIVVIYIIIIIDVIGTLWCFSKIAKIVWVFGSWSFVREIISNVRTVLIWTGRTCWNYSEIFEIVRRLCRGDGLEKILSSLSGINRLSCGVIILIRVFIILILVVVVMGILV